MNLASLLAQNEQRFSVLNNNNFFIKLINVLKARQSGVSPSVKSAYIKLLSAFLEHKSGIEWMVICTFWEDIYQLSLLNSRDLTESTKFMTKLLEKTVEHDEIFCNNVVRRIMQPLGENIYKSVRGSNDVLEVQNQVTEYLKPTLTLIGTILENFLDRIFFGRNDFSVVLIFLKNFHLEERISDFMVLAQSKCLAFDLSKIMFIMQFLELYVNAVTNNTDMASLNVTMQRIKNNFIVSLSKGCFKEIISISTFGQLYWNLMETKVPLVQNNETVSFCDRLVVLQILPQLCLLLKYYWTKDNLEEMWSDVFRESFIIDLFKMLSCQNTIRLTYMWRDFLVNRDDLFEICIFSYKCIRKSRKYYSRKCAVVVVQTMIYIIKDVVTSIKESPSKLDIFLEQLTYFSLLFEVLGELIEEFQITWKDSLESIDLLAACFDFLMLPNWPTGIIVLALKLVNTATSKYMAPNLALLVDRISDSTIALMGPLLYAKLFDDMKEVKMAALDVISTIARMAGTSKFYF